MDRANLQKEVESLSSEIDRIADSANFNGQKLLNGSLTANTVVRLRNAPTAASQAGLDLNIVLNGYKKTDGTYGKFSVSFATGTSLGATFSSGKLTLTLKNPASGNGVTWTAEDIRAAIAAVSVASSNVDQAAILDALKNVSVTGKGLIAKNNATGITVTGATPVNGKDKLIQLQIGDSSDEFNQMSVNVNDMHVKALGIDEINIGDQEGAAAIDKINEAINFVSSTRGDLGAIQNHLEHTTNNLGVMKENIQDDESTIRDVDVADEMMKYTKNNILIQASLAMLAQANQVPQGVLQLLQ